MNNIVIELKSVNKEVLINDFPIKVLDNINFYIKQGEFVVITGPSSSGKSLILNLIGGLAPISSGNIIINNNIINKLSKENLNKFRKTNISFIFQKNNLIKNLSALENIMIAMEDTKSNINPLEILEKLCLSDKINNFPDELSGGEKQRINIARAICKNTPIVLCDEPTSSLDPDTSNIVLNLLKDINNNGSTVILATHNKEIRKLADRIIYLENGRIHSIIENNN